MNILNCSKMVQQVPTAAENEESKVYSSFSTARCTVALCQFVNLSMSKEATRRWQSGSCWELELQVGVVVVCAHQPCQ